jgi:hypothetical protein
LSAYIRAADLLPTNVEVQLKAGRILLARGQFEDGLARADGALDREVLFGQASYKRARGEPVEEFATFDVTPSIAPPFRLHVTNGHDDGSNRVTAAWITVNDVHVAGPSHFGRRVAGFELPLTLFPGTNTLRVRIAGAPGSVLTLRITGSAAELQVPRVVSILPHPLALAVGSTGTLHVMLTPTPLLPGTLQVQSSTPGVVSVPAKVSFAAGQTDVPISVIALSPGHATITASLGGTSADSMVSVAGLPDQVLVYRIASPDVSTNRAETLAKQGFGLVGVLIETPGSIDITEAADGGRVFTLYKNSGAIEFVDTDKYQNPSYIAEPPDAAAAVQRATSFLQASGLLPPNATVNTRLETTRTELGDIPNAIRVDFMAHLAVSAVSLVPVRNGHVSVWLGTGGEIVRASSYFRPVEPTPISTSVRSASEVFLEVEDEVPLPEGLALMPAYVVFNAESAQPYLDPVFEVTNAAGDVLATTPATQFTPRAALIEPDPGVPLTSDNVVTLSVAAIDGTPPYQFEWASSLDGALGSGENLNVQLSPGLHAIDVTVRDVNGAGWTGTVLLEISEGPSGFARPAPAVREQQQNPQPVLLDRPTQFTNGFRMRVVTDANRPLILNSVSRGGVVRASNIYFDQFWYDMNIRLDGGVVGLVSGKCRAKPAAGVDACDWPATPFAQSAGATPITMTNTADGQILKTSITILELPGELKLDFEYNVGGLEFAGPEPSGREASQIWNLDALPWYGVVYPLGGKAPAIRPTVKWTYTPPYYAGPLVFGGTVLDFCGQRPEACTPREPLQNVRRDQLYEIVSFGARLLTAAQTHSAGQREISAFVQDTSSPNKLGQTSGAIDRSFQPLFAPQDSFVGIEPAPAEGRVLAAVAFMPGTSRLGGFRGDFDNVHIKLNSSPFVLNRIYFPNCNRAAQPSGEFLDTFSCLHMHESWVDRWPSRGSLDYTAGSVRARGHTYSKGQTVYWYNLAFRADESSPGPKIATAELDRMDLEINNAESLLPTKDLVLWVESIGRSTQCGTPGGNADNTRRPCIVFPQGLFFTPR